MFKGTYTALVTAFKGNGEIDYSCISALIEEQIKAGVNGIVVMGTTGESPSVSQQEHSEIIDFVIKEVRGRSLVIAGTGANNTEEAIYLTQKAEASGADASLQVCPYYNKPSQEGVFLHYKAIAEASKLPLILYNVPSRTGLGIELDTVYRLAHIESVVAIKEAAASVERVIDISMKTDLCVLSGDDALSLSMMISGAQGLISVLSNVFPYELTQLTQFALSGNWEESQRLFTRFYPLMEAMFIESNPIPVKTVLAMQGKIQEVFRLPLCRISDKNRQILSELLNQVK